jgi:DUF971 family protein
MGAGGTGMIRLFLALLLLAAPAAALEPERREAVVISARVWDGFAYKETFVPSTAATLHLMAGQDSAISLIRTQEYYWPLSRQVYVDFERQRDEVAGVLRLTQGGRVVAEVAPQPYAVLYPEGAVNGNASLIWGDAAVQAFDAYQREEAEFARTLVAAQRAQSAYERALLEAGASRRPGEPAAMIAPPPPVPEPGLRLVTRPALAFRLGLDPGAYDAVLMVDGAPVPGTARRVEVVDLAGRDALVADILPEERWTRPLGANTSAARIFARPGAVFYVTLAEATRFDEPEYLRVVSPQAEVVPGRPLWVRRKPAAQDRLTLRWEQGAAADLPMQRLKVEQTQGSGFGYRVRPATAAEKADLSAFVVAVPEANGAGRGVFAAEATGFRREVVVVPPRHTPLALGLALLPLAGGLGLWVLRRRRVRG